MTIHTDTDRDWELWGQKDPYFGVITDPRFRKDQLSEAERDYFFQSGQGDAQYVLALIQQKLDAGFFPKTVLDYGCGVGRVLFAFAARVEWAVGIDVSASMLAEAELNRARLGLPNVELHVGANCQPVAGRQFDLVHSAIVLQHVAVPRGLEIFRELVACVAPGGVGAVQVTYSKSHFAPHLGLPPPPPPPPPQPLRRRLIGRGNHAHPPVASTAPPGADPLMLMNAYPLTPMFFLLQTAGITSVHTQFTDHGGELGVFLFFQRPLAGG